MYAKPLQQTRKIILKHKQIRVDIRTILLASDVIYRSNFSILNKF